MSMWSFYFQQFETLWNNANTAIATSWQALAMACLPCLAHLSVRSSAPLACWIHQGCTQQKAKRQASGGQWAEQILDACRWEDAHFQMIYWSFQVPWVQTHSVGAAKMVNRLTSLKNQSYQSYEWSCARLLLLHAATWLVRFYISTFLESLVSCFTHCRGHGMMTGRSSPWRAMAATFDGFCRLFFARKIGGIFRFCGLDCLFEGAIFVPQMLQGFILKCCESNVLKLTWIKESA